MWVDSLKVLLIAAIIAGHAVIGYAGFTDAWSYSDVREVTLSPVTEAVLLPMLLLTAFAMPLLFLIAGLLTRPSVERKGPADFARDRLVRLGVPFVVFALLMWPLLEYGLFRWLGGAPGLWDYLRAEGSLDTGVLWFVGVLLIFSLVYAGWVQARGGHPGRPRWIAISFRHLLALVVTVTLATFLVRLLVPMESDNKLVDLNMWEWPVCAGMFALGIAAAEHGWLRKVPDRLRRQGRAATLVAVAAVVVLVGFGETLGVAEEDLAGGWHWAALLYAAGESTLAVFGAVWLLGEAQRHLNRPLRWARPPVARSAYGAFLVQGPVLIALALALRPIPLPAEAKALLVAAGGVTASFALAQLAIAHSRRIARVL